jgi:hypothetical protein
MKPIFAQESGWRRVVFSAACNDDGDCPICGIDYAECGCPGPTQDDLYDYRTVAGVLYAKEKAGSDPALPQASE